MADIPPCPAWKRGDCPKSDPFLVDDNDAGGDYSTFICRTCRRAFAISTPHGKSKAAFHNDIRRKQSLCPTARDRIYFDLGRTR